MSAIPPLSGDQQTFGERAPGLLFVASPPEHEFSFILRVTLGSLFIAAAGGAFAVERAVVAVM